jgi:nucleotide-binding universal stress UspA family protein
MRVLAALDDPGAPAVAQFAAALARVLGAEPDAVHVQTDGVETAEAAAASADLPVRIVHGDVANALRREAEADDVVAVVLGRSSRPRGGPVGAVAAKLLATLPKPVAIVPADTPHAGRLARVLVPLEGTTSASLAPRRALEIARSEELEVVCLHVFDPTWVPAVSDQPQHELASWTQEFLARYAPAELGEVRLETRIGRADEQIVAAAAELDVDLVAFGWARELAHGRAPIVRAALAEARLPLFLIPVTVGNGSSEHAATRAGGA